MRASRRHALPRRQCRVRKAPRRCAAPFRWWLVVMAKAPMAGRVKTRLGRELGVGTAVRFARHSLASLVQRTAIDGRWSTTLAVTPDAEASRLWPRGVPLIGQGRGDLGARMQRLFDRAPPGPVVIVGTDIPGVRCAHIAAAFRRLGRHDAVLGPATDGGYWLIGLRRRPRVLRPFRGVRWSTEHALADTLANLRGHSIARLATLCDVDSPADLAGCAASFGRRIR
jgi:rSAM/selenodomain-associated transferase 1